ncbi:hypothetical protein BCR39DRAFT_503569 [Naematelia encephala]|uniref:Uncharacterized protein n=1 Tax=Naematelia encephala TaxID=71784 RepID=A0A1Y2BHI0_9TREE|nr:hypothetical protein BCR39DRAFT_503569 [Naematelia encephala]
MSPVPSGSDALSHRPPFTSSASDAPTPVPTQRPSRRRPTTAATNGVLEREKAASLVSLSLAACTGANLARVSDWFDGPFESRRQTYLDPPNLALTMISGSAGAVATHLATEGLPPEIQMILSSYLGCLSASICAHRNEIGRTDSEVPTAGTEGGGTVENPGDERPPSEATNCPSCIVHSVMHRWFNDAVHVVSPKSNSRVSDSPLGFPQVRRQRHAPNIQVCPLTIYTHYV